VLEESIARMGTTFSTYRTLWNEPGEYGENLLVYEPRVRTVPDVRDADPPHRAGWEGPRFFCRECQKNASLAPRGRRSFRARTPAPHRRLSNR